MIQISRISILLFISLIITLSANSQIALAKLKFEDAETAYNSGDYEKSILKLAEAEKLFGKANPPILHLRILCKDKLLPANYRFSFLDSLRKEASFFLKTYADVEGLEEKYKEVYRINEKYDSVPSDKEGFDNYIKEENDKIKRKQELAEQANPATIYVLRKTGYFGSAVGFYVFVNGENKCKLNTGKYMQISLQKGKHVFNIQPNGKELKDKTQDFEFEIQAGKVYFINVDLNSWSGKLSLELLDNKAGNELWKRLTRDTCN